jgi:phosphonate transport system substrate-binding protein
LPQIAIKSYRLLLIGCLLLLGVASCSAGASGPVLNVGGIPDQDSSRLARRYQVFSDYLSQSLGVDVKYVPSVDYAAVVTAFDQGGLQLAFFGGLTGVQARLRNEGARAIAQRLEDAAFHSKFIVRAGLPIDSLESLKAQAGKLTITFGSESSTSGHLMPRHFLKQAGIDPDRDFKVVPNFSGSHDLTWKLVASGAFDVGVMSEAVWLRAVREGQVDSIKVREFFTTPDYFDYNWTARPNLDAEFGPGFTNRLQDALLSLNPNDHGEILELFTTEGFITSDNSNYREIELVARELGIIR